MTASDSTYHVSYFWKWILLDIPASASITSPISPCKVLVYALLKREAQTFLLCSASSYALGKENSEQL